MARIPEEEIERLKKEVSLERLAERKGVKLRQHGKDLLGLCPFHEDREPSLVISPAKNLWHCLGACQSGGSVIDWVMRAEGVSFRHAVELLRVGLPALESFPTTKRGRQQGPVAKQTTMQKLPSLIEATAADEVLLRQVVDYYHETLKQSPEAMGYLRQRGLASAEMVERFRLGFSNRTLGYRLPKKNRKSGAELRSQLQRLGVFRQSGHEHFAGSLVIPILDEQGRVTEMYGRKITTRLREGTPLHLYLPGPHRGVWNLPALRASQQIILCESLIDALTFWCAGFRNVTTSYGVEGFTEEHLAAFKEHGTERVLIGYDRDAAGDRAAEKLAQQLSEAGIESCRLRFPRGMDANEYAQKVQPASRSLQVVIQQAQWLGKGKARGQVITLPAAATPEAGEPAAGEQPQPPQPTSEPEARAPAPEAIPPLAADPNRTARSRQSDRDEVNVAFADRKWRVRGLGKNTAPEAMKVNVLVAREAGGFHVDSLELYSARQRTVFVKMAADELGVEERIIKRDLGQVLLKLEELQEQKLLEEAAAKTERPKLSEEQRQAALELLRAPNLMERLLEDFDRCGIVGERLNKLTGYLAAVSRKLDEPLAIIIQSSSAAGKSSLMEAILSLMPQEERVQYSAMTGQSLFYMGEHDLAHKILAIVEEEGAERAAYALKLLQSEGQLTIASTGKDPTTGRLVTQEYRVVGPVMIFLTTTAIEIDEELLNRCIVLTVDEGREQTRAIHETQRRSQTLEGVLAKEARRQVLKVHRNAQRLLRPLTVVNPYAKELTFLDHQTRTRRDHMKYLTLIRSVALLHQYQRPVQSIEHEGRVLRYIEATKGDIAMANRLAHEVLGRSLDELPPQTRSLLQLLDQMVRSGCQQQGVDRSDFRFSRRQVREHSQWGQTQLRIHLARLVEMEYVVVHRGGRGQGYCYELAYDGQGKDGQPFLIGLHEVESDTTATATWRGSEPSWRGSDPELAGGWRPDIGGVAGGWRTGRDGLEQQQGSSDGDRDPDEPQNPRLGKTAGANRSVVESGVAPLAAVRS